MLLYIFTNKQIRGIKVKLLGPCIIVRPILVFQSMLLLVYEYFCEYTLSFSFAPGVDVESM